MGDLLLVRHGETEWSVSGQHTSWTDLPLTQHGEEQAKSLAPLLSRRTFARALTSPLDRAIRTAELAGVTGAVVDSDLHEWDYGAYEGVTSVEIHRTRPDWDLWTDGVPPGPVGQPGESPEQIGQRADRVLSRVDAALLDGDVVLVAHGHFLRVLTARRLGLPAADGRLFQLATGTVSRLSTEHGRPVIAEWNTRA
ncbi:MULTISPECIES: histidine phosphatase family protein [unclassified Streptomyces]|uniref:histidine phosphatase family protein n=1 Tax=unclassified Streptomyces TaxID=2593676 RepID=UPI0022564A6B|nr:MULTISPECIES: histidine phosphatase family protein [unclassified Streptomyces]MCX5052843.1 histidine phosphatase family protein [Streptomyces sp. NBC_00474]MCX5062666.1 histidine phosphatase family protein [Streptomyces sp. NBC_00452]MCX5291726.1 histidine phosphatase family protein [Streptomyces sp. NBC_00183]